MTGMTLTVRTIARHRNIMKPDKTKNPKAWGQIKKNDIIYLLNPKHNIVDNAIYTVTKSNPSKLEMDVEFPGGAVAQVKIDKSPANENSAKFIQED